MAWFNSGKKKRLVNSIGIVISVIHEPGFTNPVDVNRFDFKTLETVDKQFEGVDRNIALYQMARLHFISMAERLAEAADASTVKPNALTLLRLLAKLEPELNALGVELPVKSRSTWAMGVRLRQLSALAKTGDLEMAQIKREHWDGVLK